MKYVSTRGGAPAVNFVEALFNGLAPDGGLYVPDRISRFTPAGLVHLKDESYVAMAIELIYPFVSDDIRTREFSRILNNSIKVFSKNPQNLHPPPSENSEKKVHPVPAPLRPLEENLFLLELFHGPTLAFKDFALQFLAGLMDYFLQQEKRKILVLGATSGDTGSAAIEAFRHYPEIKMVILHPHNRVTDFQRRQMTTTGAENVWNIAVEGNFDDCQQLVKDCFNQRDFLTEGYNLTAVNSINWARIMAQIVYYFSAFFQAGCDFKKKYCFTVPTGNFGNVLAGYYAKCMGLPIEKFLVAVNQNDILHRLFAHNDCRITELKPSYSPSMDILVSSNLERLFYLLNSPYLPYNHILNFLFLGGKNRTGKVVGRMMEKFKKDKQLKLSEDNWAKMKEDFLSISRNDEETLETIAYCYEKYGVIIDPHTAVGLGGILSLTGESQPLEGMSHILLATAHPMKFSEAIEKALPEVPLPPSETLNPEELEKKPEKYDVLPNDLDQLKDYLLQVIRR